MYTGENEDRIFHKRVYIFFRTAHFNKLREKKFCRVSSGIRFSELEVSFHFLIFVVLFSLNQFNDFGCDENAQIKGTVFPHT